MAHRSASEIQTPLTTENTEITERIPRRSATDVHSDPESFDPLGQLPDVEVYQETNWFLRVFLSVISVFSVVPWSSCLPESSPRFGATTPCFGRGRPAPNNSPQRLTIWPVALPWPILPGRAVLIVLCRVIEEQRAEGTGKDSTACARPGLDPVWSGSGATGRSRCRCRC